MVKFYYQVTGDASTRGAYVKFPVDDLESKSALTVTPTDLQDCTSSSLPVIWGASLVDQGEYTYVYGWGGDGAAEKSLFLARTPADADPSDQSRWHYYAGLSGSGAQWASSCASAQPLKPKAKTDFSLIVANGLFWLVRHTPGATAPGEIVAMPSRNAWGFGSEQVDLYTPPETRTNPKYSSIYGVRVHPGALSDPNRLLISYTVGTSAIDLTCWVHGYSFPDSYSPRFIDVAKTAFFSPKVP
ncbi:hypothetical protein [Microbispora amethystogenes]|uniref:DUF4185 domain-containing protein n=1 Tax=Microbispora amethystogenes TaxID=1427754 RepID=A0ABQ4F6M0_9ACTN|nr:hypothetical protein [Microbispora amethystogenes]GIH30457.1 hypothetical protein Mam01_06210 [Microbispora amethystogenes]